MNISDIVCCPRCKGDVSFGKDRYECAACRTGYVVKDGVPALVDLESIPGHLARQIEYFEHESVSDTEYHVEDWQRSYLERFLDNFPDVSGKTVIDCGTGSGYMAIELARRGASVIACDLTMKSLVRLKKTVADENLSDRVALVSCSAEELPFKNGIADFFISNAVLEHLPREIEAVGEIDRVSKADAGLMIAVPLSYWYLCPFLLPVNIVHDRRIGHLRRYDEDRLERLFPSWTLRRTYYTGHFSKVVKVLVNMVLPIFDGREVEREDAARERERSWASNIVVFFRRG